MRVLGIDPGYGRLGFAVVEQQGSRAKALAHGVIDTPAKDSMPIRLRAIHDGVVAVITEHAPSCIATEKLLFSANRATAMDVAKAQGVVLLAAAERGLEWTEYTPAEIKMSVAGAGNADKRQVQWMVVRLLGLTEAPKPDDVTDALAVALCHLQSAALRGF